MTTRERIQNEYAGLVESFANSVKGMAIEGIPAPLIPIAGRNYDKCAYKMAFVGMETKETKKSRNCQRFIEDPEKVIAEYEKWFNDSEMFKHGVKSAYWNFIKNFLDEFYNKTLKKTEIMTSFVWGNTNSIERYEITAKNNAVNRDVWEAVKKASKPFDNINHIIDAANPKIVFILYKSVEKEYFLAGNNACMQKHAFTNDKGKKITFRCYYLRNRDTHVFVTHHPVWMKRSGNFQWYINALIDAIKAHNILPQYV